MAMEYRSEKKPVVYNNGRTIEFVDHQEGREHCFGNAVFHFYSEPGDPDRGSASELKGKMTLERKD
jgi:hypothetical protein